MSDEGLTTLTPERVRELLWEHQGRATGQKFAPYSTLLVGEFFALCDAWLAAQGREEWRPDGKQRTGDASRSIGDLPPDSAGTSHNQD